MGAARVFVYKLFTPRVAHYILRLTFTFAAPLFLYLSAKNLFNRRVALLASLIYTTDHWYHGPSLWASGGWNYHNTACLAYYFASFSSCSGVPASKTEHRCL